MEQFTNKVIQGDCLEVMKGIPDKSVDSIVTDPPYELGFMGKKWDNSGIAYNVEMWKECLRVLKPGGHLLSFGGTRTYHRMASAIEDAGFEVRDMIEWVYGSGFPKSHNIGKAVDKLQGNEREDLGYNLITPRQRERGTNRVEWTGALKRKIDNNVYGKDERNLLDRMKITKGTSEWEGWGTALKPAHEPICLARKPLAEKTVAENCLKWGTGGINIDDSRVKFEKGDEPSAGNRTATFGTQETISGGDGSGGFESNNLGRFPANLIHDNSEEVRECFPETKPATSRTKRADRTFAPGTGYQGGYEELEKDDVYNDGGGNASRFFKSIIYQAKASKSERNKGMDNIEAKEWKQENSPNPNRKERPFLPVKNNHPTVKPIALMEYLIKMVTPKGGIVLDPFAGSGSTLVAAKQNGYQYIGIELTEEYIPIINARLNNR